jgi:HEAT repeat protein
VVASRAKSRGVGSVFSPLGGYLEELRDSTRPLVVSKLANLSNLSPEELAPFLGVWPTMAADRRRRILNELAELAEDNVELNFDEVFRAALGDADSEVRRVAVRGLWEYTGRDLIEPLVRLLHEDAEPAVRAEAALALGRFALRAEFEELRPVDAERVEKALRRTVDEAVEVVEVRARAVEALGARSMAWVQAIIEETYHSAEQRLRVSAVHAMGRNCDPVWLPVLFRELASEDPEMRYEAVTACGSIGDEASLPHVLPLMEDGDAEVQGAAIEALGAIGGRAAKKALQQAVGDPREHVREAALAALAEADFNDDPLSFRYRL